jgi:hypothetical protein
MTHILGKKSERMCRGCGCTENDACVTEDGPCSWLLFDIETPTGFCTACAVEVEWDQEAIATFWNRQVMQAVRRAMEEAAA